MLVFLLLCVVIARPAAVSTAGKWLSVIQAVALIITAFYGYPDMKL